MRDQAKEKADIFRIFSNDKRILIFWLLSKEELAVNDIAEKVGTSIQNTSQHLRLMKDKDIVQARRDGKEIYYRISNNDIGRFCKQVVFSNLNGHSNNQHG